MSPPDANLRRNCLYLYVGFFVPIDRMNERSVVLLGVFSRRPSANTTSIVHTRFMHALLLCHCSSPSPIFIVVLLHLRRTYNHFVGDFSSCANPGVNQHGHRGRGSPIFR